MRYRKIRQWMLDPYYKQYGETLFTSVVIGSIYSLIIKHKRDALRSKLHEDYCRRSRCYMHWKINQKGQLHKSRVIKANYPTLGGST